MSTKESAPSRDQGGLGADELNASTIPVISREVNPPTDGWRAYRQRVIDAAAARKFADVYHGLAKTKPQSTSAWTAACCPFHEDARASFGFNTDTGVWKCFVACGSGGPFDYIERVSGETFPQSMYSLGDMLGVERPVGVEKPVTGNTAGAKTAKAATQSIGGRDKQRAAVKTITTSKTATHADTPRPPIPDALIVQWRANLHDDADRLSYLHDKRGLTDATIAEFELGYSPERDRYTIPVRNAASVLVNVRLYSNDPDAHAKMLNYTTGRGGKHSYGRPARLFSVHRLTPMGKTNEDGSPVLPPVICIAEGEFDTMMLWQHGFEAVTSTHGADTFDESWLPIFKDRYVAIIFDLDDAGKRGAQKVVDKLRHAGMKSVHNVLLPLSGTPEDKDISDFFFGNDQSKDDRTQTGLQDIIQKTVAHDYKNDPAAKKSIDNRTSVEYVTGHGHIAVVSAIKFGIAKDPTIFVRGRRLVTIVEVENAAPVSDKSENAAPDSGHSEHEQSEHSIRCETGTPVIVSISRASVWSLLSRTVNWRKWIEHKGDHKPIDPPKEVVSAIYDSETWPGVRVLNSITSVPVFRPDGTIHDTPGYDPATKAFYSPPMITDSKGKDPKYARFKIPKAPTLDDAKREARKLLDLVCDFPFEGDADQSAWLAALLSVIGWPAYSGCAPLFLFTSNTRAAGKSKLCDLISIISTGRTMPRSPYVAHDDELRKRITSHVLAGDMQVLVDNVPSGGTIGWPSLDAALTGDHWRDRILGASELVDLPINITWFFTGNNLGVKEDTARRTLCIRLESKEEYPENRTGFKYPELLDWTRQHRNELIASAITVLRAYIVYAGPSHEGGDVAPANTPLGSFESWSRLIRNTIIWLGEADPVLTLAAHNQDADPERAAHVALMVCWLLLDPKRQGIEVGALLRWLVSDSNTDPARVLGIAPARNTDMEDLKANIGDALVTLRPPRGSALLPNGRQVGQLFRGLRGRPRSVEDEDGSTTMMSFDRTPSKGQSRSVRWIVTSK